jgi:phage repressor protein C with HTH and peptisase S24 domain
MFDEGSCSEAEPFALMVHGDSMEPEFKHGCIILIDPTGVVRNESYVVAKNADGLIFRQLIIEDERYILHPLNPVYDDEEIEGLHMVTGLVVKQAGRRRKDSRRYDQD